MRRLVSDVYDKQNKKKENVSKCSWLTWRLKYLLKTYSTYDRIRMTSKGYENETQYVDCIVSNWKDLSYEMNIIVQGKQAREKWMRHELMCICCLKIGKLAYEIKWWIYIDKENFMHDTNQCEVQNRRLG